MCHSGSSVGLRAALKYFPGKDFSFLHSATADSTDLELEILRKNDTERTEVWGGALSLTIKYINV